MTASAQSRSKAPAKAKLVYRGVKLQRPSGQPHFTISQIKKAVEDAVEKNAGALANQK